MQPAPAHAEEADNLSADTSYEDPYTVEGVEVDITAENAVKARLEALDEAQIEAYRILAGRLLGEGNIEGFESPDPMTAGSLVKDFEVTNEQLSAIRYKGTFTVRFHPRESERHFMIVDHTAFDATGAQIYDPSAGQNMHAMGTSKTLILPFYQYGSRTTIWDEFNNKWMRAWRAVPISSALVVPIGDALDVGQIRNDQSLTYNYSFLKGMKNRYDAAQALIVIGTERLKPDGTMAFEVNSYTASEGGPIFRGTQHFDSRAGETPQIFLQRVVAALQANIQRNKDQWVSASNMQRPIPSMPETTYPSQETLTRDARIAAPPLGQVTVFKGRAVYESARGWVELKKAIENASGTQGVLVKGLKPQTADIELTFAGDAQRLMAVMAQAGVSVRTVQPTDAYGRIIETGPAVFEFSKTLAERRMNDVQNGVLRRSERMPLRASYYR